MLHRPNKTRGAKEGVIEPSAADIIRPFVADLNEPPRYALHFGTVDKVGINPTSKYNTPLAVCAYPLTEEIFDQFLRIDLPFAQKDAKYLFVLEIKPDARVFYSTERFFDQGVGPEYLGADLSKIEVSAADQTTIVKIRESSFSKQFFYSTRPSGYYRNKQYFVEGGTAARAAQWGHKLWKMGIDVWVDADNEGVLHRSEPSQVMFFNPSSYRVALSMDNPKNTLQVRFGRDWAKRDDVDASPVVRALAGDKNLRGADLIEADLNSANLRGADLRGAKLNSANLTYAKLYGAKLYGADLTDARLRGAHLQDVQYDDSTTWPKGVRDVLRVWRGDNDLSGANLYRANLYGADLRGADLTRADLTDATLTRAKLIKADLTRADLFRAILTGADLTGAVLNSAKLPNADLTGADLTGADLTGAKLHDADLIDADLIDADLTGAILIGAKLRGAVLDGIIYDDSTRWPSGFIPPPSAPRPNRR